MKRKYMKNSLFGGGGGKEKDAASKKDAGGDDQLVFFILPNHWFYKIQILRNVHVGLQDLNLFFMNIRDFIVLCCQRAGVYGNQKIFMLCICNDFFLIWKEIFYLTKC